MANYQPSVIDKALVAANYCCQACKRFWHDLKPLYGEMPLRGHSSTTMHAVRDERTGLYKITSTPEGLNRMKGRILRPNAFYFQQIERETDAFMLCPRCHLRVHAIATFYSNFQGKTGNGKNAIPHVLEMVTWEFADRKGIWNGDWDY